ncbi:MAG: non-heme iron oxygenase ferredoxin subunit [Candidatus Eisenbacteria bacterium]|nr:non-heme iron oxygenase ferredoxin subunit [Candidatus Eisenbacteria bacterium]
MSTAYTQAIRTDEIPAGECRAVTIGQDRVVVCNAGGEFYAIEDVCSHDQSPLDAQRIDEMAIECPRHGARFDIRSGVALRMPAIAPVRAFPTKVIGDHVYVGLDA